MRSRGDGVCRIAIVAALASVVLGGCGPSEFEAEINVREFASTSYGAELGRCESVDGGPQARTVRVVRCELLRPNRRLQAEMDQTGRRLKAAARDRWPKLICFYAYDDTVGVAGYAYPHAARDFGLTRDFGRTAENPCGTVSA